MNAPSSNNGDDDDDDADCSGIVYRPEYNLVGSLGTLGGWLLSWLHPFDIRRSSRIAAALSVPSLYRPPARPFARPRAPLDERTLLAGCGYAPDDAVALQALRRLGEPAEAARVTEIALVALLPRRAVESMLLEPLRWQCAGTLRALRRAARCGWSVNLGGGMHHAAAADNFQAGGFCFLPDVTLAARVARAQLGLGRCMIVDLDAHQGNGHERDRLANVARDIEQTYIVDVYNGDIYPRDAGAVPGIGTARVLHTGCASIDYCDAVRTALGEAFAAFGTPDVLLYVAGTDVLDGDPLGGLHVSAQAVADRDEMVFRAARQRGVPIVMLLAGGYTRAAATAVTASLRNLARHRLIELG